jgi:hypothetical protein
VLALCDRLDGCFNTERLQQPHNLGSHRLIDPQRRTNADLVVCLDDRQFWSPASSDRAATISLSRRPRVARQRKPRQLHLRGEKGAKAPE